ncbi:unnamed protein product, partial [Laminaria digitata]
FRGECSLQITLLDLQRADRLRKEEKGLPYQIRDFRASNHPEKDVSQLQAEFPNLQIWGEVGPTFAGMKSRTELVEADSLVIWTLPPDRAVFEHVIENVQPQWIFLFGNVSDMDTSDAFLKRLIGLSKYTLAHYSGQTSLSALAAACAQTEVAVAEGLKCLSGMGLVIQIDKNGEVQIMQISPESVKQESAGDGKKLARLLKESAAYRK